jgi:hypothetical protein
VAGECLATQPFGWCHPDTELKDDRIRAGDSWRFLLDFFCTCSTRVAPKGTTGGTTSPALVGGESRRKAPGSAWSTSFDRNVCVAAKLTEKVCSPPVCVLSLYKQAV